MCEFIDTTSERQITFKLVKGREDRAIESLSDLEHLDVEVRVSEEQWESMDDMMVAVIEGILSLF